MNPFKVGDRVIHKSKDGIHTVTSIHKDRLGLVLSGSNKMSFKIDDLMAFYTYYNSMVIADYCIKGIIPTVFYLDVRLVNSFKVGDKVRCINSKGRNSPKVGEEYIVTSESPCHIGFVSEYPKSCTHGFFKDDPWSIEYRTQRRKGEECGWLQSDYELVNRSNNNEVIMTIEDVGSKIRKQILDTSHLVDRVLLHFEDKMNEGDDKTIKLKLLLACQKIFNSEELLTLFRGWDNSELSDMIFLISVIEIVNNNFKGSSLLDE